RARIFDKDGGFTQYTTTITVNNVDPTATLGNGGAVTEGSSGTVSFTSQFDPSPVDTAAGFRYSYDFNDDSTFRVGNATTYAASTSSVSPLCPLRRRPPPPPFPTATLFASSAPGSSTRTVASRSTRRRSPSTTRTPPRHWATAGR